MQINAEPAYILHKRPYRETSQILEVFSRNHGRLALMSKGSRSPRSRIAGLLQPFRPLLLSWYGRGEMPSLRSVDIADARPPQLSGKALMSAMYLNELLMIMLHRSDVHQALFGDYHETLYALPERGATHALVWERPIGTAHPARVRIGRQLAGSVNGLGGVAGRPRGDPGVR